MMSKILSIISRKKELKQEFGKLKIVKRLQAKWLANCVANL